MNTALKYGGIGFLISFVGSIPFGYLTVAGFQVLQVSGINSLVWYLLGVILLEFLVIYGTFIFAKKLLEQKKLLYFIEVFTILFMLFLALFFYQNSTELENQSWNSSLWNLSPFVIGLGLSSLNFMQIPFWTSWNIFVLHNKLVTISTMAKSLYFLGCVIGSFIGMFIIVLILDYSVEHLIFIQKNLFKSIFPIAFTVIALYQTYSLCKKVQL